MVRYTACIGLMMAKTLGFSLFFKGFQAFENGLYLAREHVCAKPNTLIRN